MTNELATNFNGTSRRTTLQAVVLHDHATCRIVSLPTVVAMLLALLLCHGAVAQHYDPHGEYRRATTNSKVNMHLLPQGKWEVGKDKWGEIVRVNMFKIGDTDWKDVPGVKKAWPMKGFEDQPRMAFHPIISEMKDVDNDGKPDIFRLRSEHAGARIERLRYDDGSVVWVSEPVGALYGDESRLAVYAPVGSDQWSVFHSDKAGVYCIDAATGQTRWKQIGLGGDFVVGHFLDAKELSLVCHADGVITCLDEQGKKAWTCDTKLRGDDAYAHRALRGDADGDGRDEILVNMQKLTLALRGDGSVLWEDRTQTRHSDLLFLGDMTGDGKTEFIYDHDGCAGGKGPVRVVDALTGKLKMEIDYYAAGLRHAQNAALGKFDPARPGLQLALCGKTGGGLYVWDATGKLLWKRNVPATLLCRGDWNGDGVEDVLAFGMGANVDGIFSVWNGKGERLHAISFLPSPSRRTWSDEHNGGSWSHAFPGGHEGMQRQIDVDGNGRADVMMPFGSWHWGSDSILFLMEAPNK